MVRFHTTTVPCLFSAPDHQTAAGIDSVDYFSARRITQTENKERPESDRPTDRATATATTGEIGRWARRGEERRGEEERDVRQPSNSGLKGPRWFLWADNFAGAAEWHRNEQRQQREFQREKLLIRRPPVVLSSSGLPPPLRPLPCPHVL